MALSAIIDVLRAHILAAVSPAPVTVGGATPTRTSDLPAVTLAVVDASRELAGIGRAPLLSATGALPVTTRINLADPVLRFFRETETVPLLSDGRRLLQLPHAPLVHADGVAPPPPLTAADLTARIAAGTVFTVVSGPPAAATQVQPDAAAGTLRFGAALAETGTLELTYFIGQWETRATRYQGVLQLEVFAATAGQVETLSRQVDQVLRQERADAVPGLNRIAPASWGVAGATPVLASAVARTFSYGFDYELSEPIIPTGGGVIARVEVGEQFGGDDFIVT